MNTSREKCKTQPGWLRRLVRLLSEWAWADEIATTAQYGRLRERYARLEEDHANVRGRIVRAQRIEDQSRRDKDLLDSGQISIGGTWHRDCNLRAAIERRFPSA